MGNLFSLPAEHKDAHTFKQYIDTIASKLILTQHFKDYENMNNMKYCDDLVIITSEILNDNFDTINLQNISQKIKFTTKEEFKQDDDTYKSNLCKNIAIFYVKIAHLFSAIASTINPEFKYNNDNVPSDINPTFNNLNICGARIDALLKNTQIEGDKMTVNDPSMSDENIGIFKGIPELERLYFDEFDENNSLKMSEHMKQEYNSDLKTFYKYLSGTDMEIIYEQNGTHHLKYQKFSDIPLKKYHTDQEYKSINGNIKDELFLAYAKHIKAMLDKTCNKQLQLKEILKKVFKFPEKNNTHIIIDPELTNETLDNLIKDAKEIIINMYSTCETDYVHGLEIFEAIVEKQIFESSKRQLESLQSLLNNVIYEEQ